MHGILHFTHIRLSGMNIILFLLFNKLFIMSVGYSQGDSINSLIKDAAVSTLGSPFLPPSTSTARPTFIRHQRKLLARESCTIPPEPENGLHETHLDFCGTNCLAKEGFDLGPGTLLNYTCNPGYKLIGNPFVLCEGKGNWSPIPVCREITCNALNSVSISAKCFRRGRWVSCDSSVLQETRAKVSCRPGYLPTVSPTTKQSDTVECNVDGKWKPEPIGCRPVCGVAMSGNASDFPWQATLYRRFPPRYSEAYLMCGATLIRSNLVLTTAKCVYDTNKNTTMEAETIWVMSGNIYQKYNHPLHDPKLVSKNAVKAVHINCDYHGWPSAADVALLELKDSLEFSSFRLPACLVDSNSADAILKPNAFGSVAEFGVTNLQGRPIPSGIKSIKSVPYVPYDQCKDSKKLGFDEALTPDKFCAGYSNASSTVCIYYDGGGLVFKKQDLWYLMGIVSSTPFVLFFGRELGCSNYAMITNITLYSAWIEDVIFNLERYKSHPPCEQHRSMTPVTITTEEPKDDQTLSNGEDPSCLAPPQPANGKWMFHQSICSNDAECKILQSSPLRPGIQLIYTCASGYVMNGDSEVYCGFSGNWSAIPVCSEIKCNSLNSVSTAASCYDRFGNWLSCDPAVPPGTRAEISCHLGYTKDTALSTFRRDTVKCGEDRTWSPEPIRCVPVCGVATTHQTPYIINGTAARVSDFPWHATLYMQKSSFSGIKKEFICGATIIHTNYILTAAHCVYDETTQTTTNPEKLFVMTGNIFREYDSPGHNPVSVKRTAVNHVHRPCRYYGLRGNYASDIALLEVKSPFNFSNILAPACLDVQGYSDQILEPGVYGRVAGFGRTEKGDSSGLLLTLTLPYISYNQCKTSRNAEKNEVLISSDKFCAGYTDGTAVCEGDSGGGLVFQKGELWYVLGIVSVGLGVDLANGEKTCDKYAFSLYTKVSEHMSWIQDVMFQRAQRNIYPPCDNV